MVKDNPKQFKETAIGELKREYRYKFFRASVISAKKSNLLNFEKIKAHEIFDRFRTDTLEKIAHQLEDREGSRFADLIKKY